MNFSKNIQKIKIVLNPKFLAKYLTSLLGRYIRLFTFLIVFGLVGFCIYLWYGTSYRPQWSENQVQTYMKDKGQGPVFNEKGFDYDVSSIRSREEESRNDFESLVDIFRLKRNVQPTASAEVSVSSAPPVATVN